MKPRNPYRLFDYYTEADAGLFFGREREVSAVVGDILANKLLVLFARSGSGKTSLLNAGIGPALRELGEDDASRIRLVTIRLEGDATPEQSALNALREALGESGPQPGETLHATLRRLCTFPRDGASGRQPMGLVLAFDQFEELFITLFRDRPDVRQEFARQLAAIIYDNTLRAYVVLSLRSDHFHHLNEFRDVIPSIFQNNTNLELRPFDEAAALRVIRGPTEGSDRTFTWEPGLPERIVTDLQRLNEDQDGVLPIHLQIVCYGLVERLGPGDTVITERLYAAAAAGSGPGESPAAGMIRTRILAPLEAVKSRERRRRLCRLLRALTTHHRTKQPRSLSGLSQTIPTERLKPLLEHLESHLLLRHEAAGTEVWYELRHDYLAREILPWLDAQEQALKAGDRRRRIAAMAGLAVAAAVGADLYLSWHSYTARLGVHGRPDELVLVRQPAFRHFDPAWWHREISTGFARDQLLASGVTNHSFALDQALSDWKEVESQLTARARSMLQLATRLKGDPDSTNAPDAAIFSALSDPDADRYAMADRRAFNLLLAASGSGNPEVRSDAIGALGRLGPNLPPGHTSAVAKNLMVALEDKDEDAASLALRALEEFGTNLGADRITPLVDSLLATLGDQDSSLRVHAAEVLSRWGRHLPSDRVEPVVSALVADLKSSSNARRQSAVGALTRLGNGLRAEDVGTLVTALLAAVRDEDPEVRSSALNVLNNMHPEALAGHVGPVVDGSVAALADPESDVRSGAAGVLRGLAPSLLPERARPVVDALAAAAVNDQEPSVRFPAVAALGALPDDLVATNGLAPLVEALVAGLSDPDPNLRGASAYALGDVASKVPADQIGPVAEALLAVLREQADESKHAAAYALGRFAFRLAAKQSEPVVDALQSALADRDPDIQRSVATALGGCWSRLPFERVGPLVGAFLATDENRDIRLGRSSPSIVYSLGSPLPPSTVSAIVDALLAALARHETLPGQDSDVAYSVATALGALSNQLPDYRVGEVVGALLDGVRDSDFDAVQAVAKALEGCWPKLSPNDCGPVVETLLAMLAERDSSVPRVAFRGLGVLGPRLPKDLAGRALNALVTSLDDPDPDARSSAADALGAWGHDLPADHANSVVHALSAAITDGFLPNRLVAADALARIESTFRTRPAPSILLELDQVGLWSDRASYEAAEGHAAFRSLAMAPWEQDETALLAALESDDSRWRVFALHVLARRPRLTEATLARIRTLREDARPWVRLAAFRCLVETEREKQVRAVEAQEANNQQGRAE